MPRSRYVIAGLAVLFVVGLAVVTLRSTSTPLDLAASDRAAAERSCRSAVRARLPDARFPHDASVEARGDGRLRLSGSVDAGAPPAAVRRNYECLLRRGSAGGYVADSALVWQSH